MELVVRVEGVLIKPRYLSSASLLLGKWGRSQAVTWSLYGDIMEITDPTTSKVKIPVWNPVDFLKNNYIQSLKER